MATDTTRLASLEFLKTLLTGRLVVNNKVYGVRASLPSAFPKRAYYLDEFDVVLLENLPAHIRMLRAAKGEAKALIPATREVFDCLSAAGITTEKVDDDSLKYAIIPGTHIRHVVEVNVKLAEKQRKHAAMLAGQAPANGAAVLTDNTKSIREDEFVNDAEDDHEEGGSDDSDASRPKPVIDFEDAIRDPRFEGIDDSMVVIGRAKRTGRDDPVLIFSLAEASLKSKVHANQMANALIRRINVLIDTSVYTVIRRGDNAIHVLPSQHIKESPVECLKRHPIDVKTIALLPGISKIYDPTQPPKRVRDAVAQMRQMDAVRADRIAKGLPEDDSTVTSPTDTAERPILLDSRGRPITNPLAYKYASLNTIVQHERRRTQSRIIYGEAIAEGAGGIPVLSATRALCLMSGGIDSPVAAYSMMQRGCHVDLIHFLNSTSDTAAILKKLHLIAKRLSIPQGRLEMMIVDIAELQQAIVGVVQRLDRTVVYKQYMLLIAAAVAGYHLLVTGDSVAQVASQTANNIATLYPHCPRAVISPLSGTNKTSIMEVSDRLGLFELSSMEGADCCQYLMCKTGANLCIGVGKMRGYIARVRVADIPVRTVVFQDGQEVPSASRSFTVPFESIMVNHAITIEDLAHNVAPRAAVLRRRSEEEADAIAAAAAAPTDAPVNGGLASRHVDPAAPTTADTAVPRPAATPKRVAYLDSAAASIIDPAVVDAIARAPVGNPNSVHSVGRVCRAAVEGVRHQLLNFLCPTATIPFQLVFTSGGTEANNIALHGLARTLTRAATPERAATQRTCVLYSCIAHPSIIEVAKELALRGVVDEAVPIAVTSDGNIDLAALTKDLEQRSSFRANPNLHTGAGNICAFSGVCQSATDIAAADSAVWSNVLVAVDLVNHELGNCRDMEAITRIARTYGALLHVDACQALCKVDFDASPFDSVAVTAHKINGPIGVGALAIRSQLAKRVPTIMSGGSYDGGLRPGTLNAPGIIGFGAALSLPRDEANANELYDMLLQGARKLQGVRVNGDSRQSSRRIVHMTLVGAPPDIATLSDLEIVSLFAARFNVMLSTGAACSQAKGSAPGARANEGLYEALGLSSGVTLRVSLDHNTAMRDVDAFLRGLRSILRTPQSNGAQPVAQVSQATTTV